MQIHRLFEIIYLLLEKGSVTAKELAERFEVSPRTIYRDIDILSSAGIPIYTNRGKGGGIRLLDGYVFNKTLLSDEEQSDILAGLHGLSAIQAPGMEHVLTKMAGVFGKRQAAWLDVDFSHWGDSGDEKDKFTLIKDGIVEHRLLSFDYYNALGEKRFRTVEPCKLLFKSQNWYLYAYCHAKRAERLFKISRIKNVGLLEDYFEPRTDLKVIETFWETPKERRTVNAKLRINPCISYRVYDEFASNNINKDADGFFIIEMKFIMDDWMYGYLLSFGHFLEVLEPPCLREGLCQHLKTALSHYK